MSTVVIEYDGSDITADVLIDQASFTGLVNGNPGTCSFKVKDLFQAYEFISGKELSLTIDGQRKWGGYVIRATKTYPLPVLDTTVNTDLPRYWEVNGVDYNILFSRRIVWDLDDGVSKLSWLYSPATYDDTIINDLFDNYVDTTGLTRDSVQRIAHAVLDLPGKDNDKGMIASAGFTWQQAMSSIARATGGVYYIDANKDLHYVDAEETTSAYVLTDTPGDGDIGYQGFTFLEDGSHLINDMHVWGAGTGSPNYVYSRSRDLDSIAEHGLWQGSLVTAGLYRQASADIVADSYVYGTPQSLRGGKDDATTFTCRVFEPVYNTGEVVTWYCNVFGVDGELPIRRMVITFAGPTSPIFDLTLSNEIDLPIDIYEFYFPPIDIGGGIDWPPPPPPQNEGCDESDITDTFDRPDTSFSTGAGTADCGYIWSLGNSAGISNCVSQVDSNQLYVYAAGGDTPGGIVELTGVLPFPTSGSVQRLVVGTADAAGSFILDNGVETERLACFWEYGEATDFDLRVSVFTGDPNSPTKLAYDEVLIGEIVGSWTINFLIEASGVTVEFAGYGSATALVAAATPSAIADLTSARNIGLGTAPSGLGNSARYNDLDVTGLNRCNAECTPLSVVLDDFDRTAGQVDVDATDWGLASSGNSWEMDSFAPTNSVTQEFDGTKLIIGMTGKTPSPLGNPPFVTYVGNNLNATAANRIRVKFKVSAASSTGFTWASFAYYPNMQIGFSVGLFFCSFTVWNDGSPTSFVEIDGNSGPEHPITADVWYWLEGWVDQVQDMLRARVYADGTNPNDWDVQEPIGYNYTGLSTTQPLLQVYHGFMDPGDYWEVQFDQFESVEGGCDDTGAPLVSSGGSSILEFFGNGGTAYRLANTFQALSTSVSVNGTRQTRGTDYVELAPDQIVFTEPKDLTDQITVELFATGVTITGTILQLGPTNTKAEFIAACNNMGIDVIELLDGTYDWQHVEIDVDRTGRPLTIKAAPGATCTFVGPATTSGIIFLLGENVLTKNVHFYDPLGQIIFDGIALAQSGVFEPRGTVNCSFIGMRFRNLSQDTGVSGHAAYKSWCFYISGAGSGNNDELLIEGTFFEPPATDKDVSCIQIASSGSHGTIWLRDLSIDSYFYGIAVDVPVANLIIDGIDLVDTGSESPITEASIRFFAANINGYYANVSLTNSKPILNSSTGSMVAV